MSAVLAPSGATERHDRHGAAVQNMNLMLGFDETAGLNP